MNARTTTLLLAVLIAAGCSKLTPENYAKVRMGITFDEVKAVLGSPDACSDTVGLKDCRWGDEKRGVNVKFAGEKVIFHSAHNIK